jgi:hypothetical protein
MARLALLLALLTFSAAALPAQAEAAPRKCKKGFVLKKVKKNGKTVRKCVKKKALTDDQQVVVDGGGGGTTIDGGDGGGDGGTAPPPQPEQVRNDQALQDALTNAAFYKTWNGGAGYGSYTYNFLPKHLGEVEGRKVFQLRYCTYYVSFVASGSGQTEGFNGVWVVKEGYTHPNQPGLVTGILQLWRQGMSQDQQVEAPVAVKDGAAAIKTGNGSTYFEAGDYALKPEQATTDCSAWVPA